VSGTIKDRITRKTLIRIVVLWAIVAAAIVFLNRQAQHQIVEHRLSQIEKAQNYSYLISQHFQHGFEKTEILLSSAVDQYNTLTDFGKHAERDKEKLRTYLKRQRELLPGIASFTIVRPNGRRLVGIVNKDDTDLSQRPYFVAIKDRGVDQYITQVENGMASGKDGIHIAQRIPDKSGTFNGVAVINLAAKDIFYSYFTGLGFGENSQVQLRTVEKTYLHYPQDAAEHPELNDVIKKTLRNGKGHDVIEYTNGSNTSLLIVIDRIFDTDFYSVLVSSTNNGFAGADSFIPWPYVFSGAIILSALFLTLLIINWGRLIRAHTQALKSSSERQRLIRKLNTIAEEERKGIANDIHDVMNATLIAIKLDAHSIKQRLSNSAQKTVTDQYIVERAGAIELSAKDLYAYCRSIVSKLRPETLDIHGLEKALRELVSQFNERNRDCSAVIECRGNIAALSTDIAIALYRVTQESFSNIQKYSKADHVLVQLTVADTEVRLTVQDDGIGFDKGNSRGYGLLGMKERIKALDGECIVVSKPQAGVRIDVSIPFSADVN